MHPFTEADLRRVTTARFFERGQQYREAVKELHHTLDGVTATLTGTHDYTVRLTHDGDELSGTCTCPVGQDGKFCKHCVGLGLAILDEDAEATGATLMASLREGRGKYAWLRAWLDTQDRDTLTTLLCEQAATDPRLYRQLALAAATHRRAGHSPVGPDPAALRRHLTTHLRTRGYISYSEAWTYAITASQLLSIIEQMAEGEQAPDAEALARHAVDLITNAMNEGLDDSDGTVGEELDRATALLEKTRQTTPPDPGSAIQNGLLRSNRQRPLPGRIRGL